MRIMINGRFVTQRQTGVQRVQREVVRAIDALVAEGAWPGVEIVLAVPVSADDAHLSLGLRHIPILEIPGGGGQLWEQRALSKASRGYRLMSLGNTAPLAPLLAGRPTAVMIHDLAYRLFPEDYSLAYRVAHRVCDAVILRRARPLVTVSETEASTLARSTRTPILVAANGSVGGDAFPAAREREPGGPFVYVGAFSSRKNIEAIFATAVSVARQRGIGTVFVGAPNDLSKRLEAGIPAEVSALVRFVGFVDDGELAELYGSATALFYMSRYEASGLPPTEAMAYGCPVLASDLPVLRERCGSAALYCGVDDREEMLDQALRLVDDAVLRGSLSSAGIERSRSFSWRLQASRIVEGLIAEVA